MREFLCIECRAPIPSRLTRRRTKRYCDICLHRHRVDQQAARGGQGPGVCPDCGTTSSQPGRRCDSCGRRLAGERKSQNAKRKREAERRMALALLRDWGRRHGRVAPTMAQWNELNYPMTAHRVLYVCGGWLRACEDAGLESHGLTPAGNLRRYYDKNRQMVTADGYDDSHYGAIRHYGVPVEGPI